MIPSPVDQAGARRSPKVAERRSKISDERIEPSIAVDEESDQTFWGEFEEAILGGPANDLPHRLARYVEKVGSVEAELLRVGLPS